jgi:hypothetical protein
MTKRSPAAYKGTETLTIAWGLTVEEAKEVRDLARRIAALRLLLDANYRAVKASACPWPAKAGADPVSSG